MAARKPGGARKGVLAEDETIGWAYAEDTAPAPRRVPDLTGDQWCALSRARIALTDVRNAASADFPACLSRCQSALEFLLDAFGEPRELRHVYDADGRMPLSPVRPGTLLPSAKDK